MLAGVYRTVPFIMLPLIYMGDALAEDIGMKSSKKKKFTQLC